MTDTAFLPDPTQAFQFVLMQSAGMPSRDALAYFLPAEISVADLAAVHAKWVRCKEVQRAWLKMHGKNWQDLSSVERMTTALEKHYAELAYFLYSHNYSELVGAEKQRADTCRDAIERRLATSQGKDDPYLRFMDDLVKGRVTLTTPIQPPPAVLPFPPSVLTTPTVTVPLQTGSLPPLNS